MSKMSLALTGLSKPLIFVLSSNPEATETDNALNLLKQAAAHMEDTIRCRSNSNEVSAEVVVDLVKSDLKDAKPSGYEFVVRLNNGEKLIGYRAIEEPLVSGSVLKMNSTKDMKGTLWVKMDDVSYMRSTPLKT